MAGGERTEEREQRGERADIEVGTASERGGNKEGEAVGGEGGMWEDAAITGEEEDRMRWAKRELCAEKEELTDRPAKCASRVVAANSPSPPPSRSRQISPHASPHTRLGSEGLPRSPEDLSLLWVDNSRRSDHLQDTSRPCRDEFYPSDHISHQIRDPSDGASLPFDLHGSTAHGDLTCNISQPSNHIPCASNPLSLSCPPRLPSSPTSCTSHAIDRFSKDSLPSGEPGSPPPPSELGAEKLLHILSRPSPSVLDWLISMRRAIQEGRGVGCVEADEVGSEKVRPCH